MPFTPEGSTNTFVQLYKTWKMPAMRSVPSLARWGVAGGIFVLLCVEPTAIYSRIPIVRRRFGYQQEKVRSKFQFLLMLVMLLFVFVVYFYMCFVLLLGLMFLFQFI
jgi:hypothetical protein